MEAFAKKEAVKAGISSQEIYIASMLVLGDYFDSSGEVRPEFLSVTAEQYMAAQKLLLSQSAESPLAKEVAESQRAVLPQFATSDEGGVNISRLPGLSAPVLRFGNNANQNYHAFRWTDAAGIPRDALRMAIGDNLKILGPVLSDGIYNGSVVLNGRVLDYNAYSRGGEINIGRITVRGK